MRQSFIQELNKKVNEYVEKHDLFDGGCCYSAYVLASALQKMGIKYRTVLFQYDDILHEKDFNNAINGRGVSHVAIEVTYNGHKECIGKCTGIYNYFAGTGEKFKIRRYDGISPELLLEGYQNNHWNPMYDTKYNRPFTKAIQKIVNKYVEGKKVNLVKAVPILNPITFRDLMSSFGNIIHMVIRF